MSRIQRSITRLRHRNGHGVHSPYIYSIVRNVIMARELSSSEDQLLYSDLITETPLDGKYAAELDRLRKHCVYKSSCIDRVEEVDMIVCTACCTNSLTRKIVDYGASRGITIVLLSPYATLEREGMCESIIKSHTSTTLDRRAYLIIFNNHLPKQHFQL